MKQQRVPVPSSGSTKETILIVDDDATGSEAIAKALNMTYTPVATTSGEFALSMMQRYLPDLILIGNQLKDHCGYEICREIKIDHRTADIPVIFLISLADASHALKAFDAGAVDYVVKPVEISELRHRIRTHITTRRRKMELEYAVVRRSEELEKINAALRASLDHRETEMHAIEETILTNIRKYIYPYLEKLESSNINDSGVTYLRIIRSNLKELIPSTSNRLSSDYLKLTPAEIKVADLIRQGKQTKQIAGLLNLSVKSVFYYRNNIRKKLGLRKNKVNLTSYLASLSNQ